MKTLKNFNFSKKKVLARLGLDVPIDKKGKITNDKRIREVLPTIRYLLKQKPKQIIIISHLGRPKGKIVPILKLNNVAKRLGKLLGKKVKKLDDCINIKIPEDKIVMLENLRFHKEEASNDKEFAKKLASCADCYVNDAFSVCHRKHASVSAVTKYLPICAGFLLQKELKLYNKIKKPKKPFIAIISGKKVPDKLEVINSLLKKADCLLLGPLMALPFFKCFKIETGKSPVEKKTVKIAKQLLKKANKRIILPIDFIAADKNGKNIKIVTADKIPRNKYCYDLGPETILIYKEILKKAKTVFWNGPLGYFENKKFAKGTNEIAKSLAKSKSTVIICGGDTETAVEKLRLERKINISTSGGAFLELVAGKKLPGLEALK